MPSIWIIERPTLRRRAPQPEGPRLELPLHRPTVEGASPRHEQEPEPERGASEIDFYI